MSDSQPTSRDEILENLVEQFYRKAVNVWHTGTTPEDRKPAKTVFKTETKAAINRLLIQERIDELEQFRFYYPEHSTPETLNLLELHENRLKVLLSSLTVGGE